MALKTAGGVSKNRTPAPARTAGRSSGRAQPAPTGGGGGGSAGVEGMDPAFAAQLQAFIAASGGRISITSGYRSVARQTELWNAAIQRYGSPEAARKWVAPPGRSNHGRGIAADLGFANAAAREWAHQNAARFGLHFPMGWEPWHIEPISSRGSSSRDAYTTPPDGSNFVNPRDAFDGGTDQYGAAEDAFDPMIQVRRLFSIIGGAGGESDAMSADTSAAEAGSGVMGANALQVISEAASAVAPAVQLNKQPTGAQKGV